MPEAVRRGLGAAVAWVTERKNVLSLSLALGAMLCYLRFAPCEAVAADGNPRDLAVFWITGLLSAFLDNAPTFLVFFNLAGGNAEVIGPPGTKTLSNAMVIARAPAPRRPG